MVYKQINKQTNKHRSDIVSTRAARAALAEAARASRKAGTDGRGQRVSGKYWEIYPEDVLVSMLLANACLDAGAGLGERVPTPTHLTGVRPLENVHPADSSMWGWFHHHLPGRLWRGQMYTSQWPTFAVHKVEPGYFVKIR